MISNLELHHQPELEEAELIRLFVDGTLGAAGLLSYLGDIDFYVACGLVVAGWVVWIGWELLHEWFDNQRPPPGHETVQDHDHEDWKSPPPVGPFGRM